MTPGLIGNFKSGIIGSSIEVTLILGLLCRYHFSLSPLAVFDMPVLSFSDALSCAVLCLVLRITTR